MGCRNNKMSKIALLFIACLALSSAQIQLPESLFGGNYESFRNYVDAFMSGYTNTKYTLPTDCLDSASQGKLDSDMMDVISSILKFHPYDAYLNLQVFGADLKSMTVECGLNEVPINLEKDLQMKGSWWVVSNMLTHSVQIISYTTASLVDVAALKFTSAGTNFGNALRFLIPPYNTLSSDFLEVDVKDELKDFINISKGFLDGLENSSTTGPCYSNIMKLGGIFQTGYEAAQKVLSRNLPAADTVISSVKQIYPQLKATETSCQSFDTLFTTIQAAFTTKEGLKTLYSNYYTSLKIVDADFMNVYKCSTDLYSCGKSAGNIIDILFNWSLDKQTKSPSFLSF